VLALFDIGRPMPSCPWLGMNGLRDSTLNLRELPAADIATAGSLVLIAMPHRRPWQITNINSETAACRSNWARPEASARGLLECV
jgi:hypothetical protein